MNATATARRAGVEGVFNIVRFNWPRYATALVAAVGALVIATVTPATPAVRMALPITALIAACWGLASLAVSHFVYARSGADKWDWLLDLLPSRPQRWANVHAGLDQTTPVLRQLLPHSHGVVIDLFDPALMTERSIRRARRLCGSSDADYRGLRSLPHVGARSFDTVFLLRAARGLRRPRDRDELFRQLHRLVRPRGYVVLVEHMGDRVNFLAFGPGFLHFYPRHEWLRLAAQHGFAVDAERRVTPFLRAFVLRRVP